MIEQRQNKSAIILHSDGRFSQALSHISFCIEISSLWILSFLPCQMQKPHNRKLTCTSWLISQPKWYWLRNHTFLSIEVLQLSALIETHTMTIIYHYCDSVISLNYTLAKSIFSTNPKILHLPIFALTWQVTVYP